jgi:hypothetical protein
LCRDTRFAGEAFEDKKLEQQARNPAASRVLVTEGSSGSRRSGPLPHINREGVCSMKFFRMLVVLITMLAFCAGGGFAIAQEKAGSGTKKEDTKKTEKKMDDKEKDKEKAEKKKDEEKPAKPMPPSEGC